MSSRRSSKPLKVMHMEEMDENGDIIPDTATYAASVASPTKEKMNTSKKARKKESSSANYPYTDSDSTLHPVAREKTKSRSSREPRESRADRAVVTTKTAMTPASRPSVKQHKTSPDVPSTRHRRRDSRQDDASYYGVDAGPVVQPETSRRRANTSAVPRPPSYHASDRSRPPLSNTRYHTPAPSLPFAPPPPPQSTRPMMIPFAPPPLPPPQPYAAVSYPQPPMPLPPPQQPPSHDYFMQHQRRPHDLAARFGTSSRPQSAMGHRTMTAPVVPSYPHDEYREPIDRTSITRRPSQTRRSRDSRHEEDRILMPPPPLSIPRRPMSTQPVSSLRSAGAFAPPMAFPPPPARTQTVFDDDDLDAPGGVYHDVSPLTYELPYRGSRSRRPSIGAPTVAYDTAPAFAPPGAGAYTTEIARGAGSRRSSYYGGAEVSQAPWEDKARRASTYQSEVDGGSLPLTAETLKRASRRGGSSRSSGSHEDSDWKQSATTRTTQSASDEVTIQVLKGGSSNFKIAGVPIECEPGTVFSVNSRTTGDRDRGSDRSSYMGEEERSSRRLHRVSSGGARAPSQSASYSRGMGAAAYPDYGSYGTYGGYAPPQYPQPGGYF